MDNVTQSVHAVFSVHCAHIDPLSLAQTQIHIAINIQNTYSDCYRHTDTHMYCIVIVPGFTQGPSVDVGVHVCPIPLSVYRPASSWDACA